MADAKYLEQTYAKIQPCIDLIGFLSSIKHDKRYHLDVSLCSTCKHCCFILHRWDRCTWHILEIETKMEPANVIKSIVSFILKLYHMVLSELRLDCALICNYKEKTMLNSNISGVKKGPIYITWQFASFTCQE